ncbi:hypothetical protein [Haloferax chudinovii]|uniref:Uncharacterized protein n=1 Tax=Haloferax chudinovii TaxID=1109010 RepID=A0ABD5XHJ3_9EURY
MDTALERKLDIIIALLFLLLLIESYRVAGYFGATLVIILGVVFTYGVGSEPSSS